VNVAGTRTFLEPPAGAEGCVGLEEPEAAVLDPPIEPLALDVTPPTPVAGLEGDRLALPEVAVLVLLACPEPPQPATNASTTTDSRAARGRPTR
jgi:hypothetical protein